MNKDKAKLIKILIFLSFLSIVVALIIDHSNFARKQNNNEQPEKVGKNILLSDGFQEADNLSTYQKFQEFWNGVYLQNASNWSYVNWREYIIMQIYGSSEEELNNTIKTDPLFEHNIDIFTVIVMGKFNGSLSEQDIINLKDQLIHNTVRIGDISFLKSNDDQLKISVNVEVESSPSMWYVADRLEIYLKSENSTGKWYNDSGNHYIKVSNISNLELSDPFYADGKYKNYIISPIIINTNIIEQNVSLRVKLDYFLNFVIEDYVEEFELFNIDDDDKSPPEILYTYTGDYTDGNPGELVISVLDDSDLSVDPSGTYTVPNSLGSHKFFFYAIDNDNDRANDMLSSNRTIWINITDDDILTPEITYAYTGDGTDGNPGELIVNAFDVSGLSLDPSGTYQVPNTLGNHKFVFTASDADDDRQGDILNTTIIVWINITDDDILTPEITYTYTGDGTDGNPGELIVNAFDVSGLSLDPSGTYQVPNTLGNHKFVFTASDADDDRLGDILNTTIIVWINIIDDDDKGPIIRYINITNNNVYDYYEFIIIDILAEDESGISKLYIEFNDIYFYDDDGDNQILIENPRIPGMYNFTIIIIDGDNDREEDQSITQSFSLFEVFDDDTTPPQIYLYPNAYYYQIIILDNDGKIDSKATGEYFLIDGKGIILESGIMLEEDINYTIRIPLEPGNYTLEIYLTNNDIEWDGDEEFNLEIFNIIVDIESYFLYIDKLLEDLINYVERSAFVLGDSIIFKLRLAQANLKDAYMLVMAKDANCGLFNEIMIQAIIEFVEFETEFYNKIDLISEEVILVIISSLHEIRNSVIKLMGLSVDYVKEIDYGFDIASIEVEILNLKDYIEELDDIDTKYLEKLTTLAALQLELAIIKLSRNITPDSALTLAKNIIDRAKEEVNRLVNNEKISAEIADILLGKLECCYFDIEQILLKI